MERSLNEMRMKAKKETVPQFLNTRSGSHRPQGENRSYISYRYIYICIHYIIYIYIYYTMYYLYHIIYIYYIIYFHIYNIYLY